MSYITLKPELELYVTFQRYNVTFCNHLGQLFMSYCSSFLVCLVSGVVFFLCIVHSWFPLRFSLTFNVVKWSQYLVDYSHKLNRKYMLHFNDIMLLSANIQVSCLISKKQINRLHWPVTVLHIFFVLLSMR
jgi:hypothetical protein